MSFNPIGELSQEVSRWNTDHNERCYAERVAERHQASRGGNQANDASNVLYPSVVRMFDLQHEIFNAMMWL